MQRSFPIDPALASILAERRKANGLTQNDLALALGVSESTIGKMETARVPVPPSVKAKIEAAIEQLSRERSAVPA